jgi:kinesin family protein 4/21/27
MKESIDINKSLFALRQVINCLIEKQQNKKDKTVHIPFRESKLTSLLKNSLGGSGYCYMIACLVPVDQFWEENLSTLVYASKTS